MESTLWAKRNDVLEGDVLGTQCTNLIFFNWDSQRGMELQEEAHKKIKAYRKSVLKKYTDKRSLLILDFKPFR